MRIQDVMTREVSCCRPGDSLSEAARCMWECDCGATPIIDEERRVVGILTDRDICMAAYTRGAPLHAIEIASVMSTDLCACRPGDALEDVETQMRRHRVRRIPVVDEQDRLVGIVSLNDLALEFQKEQGQRRKSIKAREVAETLAAICEHQRQPALGAAAG